MLSEHFMRIDGTNCAIILEGVHPDSWEPIYSVRHIATGEVPPYLQPTYDTVQAAYADYMRHREQFAQFEARPEMDKVMTLSTAHISEKTAIMLQNELEANKLCLAVYPKCNFGWFIYLAGVDIAQINALPDDLRCLCKYAKANNCSILCLDCDGPILGCLPTFEWSDKAPQLD